MRGNSQFASICRMRVKAVYGQAGRSSCTSWRSCYDPTSMAVPVCSAALLTSAKDALVSLRTLILGPRFLRDEGRIWPYILILACMLPIRTRLKLNRRQHGGRTQHVFERAPTHRAASMMVSQVDCSSSCVWHRRAEETRATSFGNAWANSVRGGTWAGVSAFVACPIFNASDSTCVDEQRVHWVAAMMML